MKLTVATYNILHGAEVGYDWGRLAEAIRSCGADVVGLQEVDRGTRRAGGSDATTQLLEQMGWTNGRFAQAMLFDDGEYGIAYLSRFPSVDLNPCAEIALPHQRGEEPRTCMHTVLELAGRRLHFLNTHLAFERPASRAPQIHAIQAYIDSIPPDEPFVLTGDFNTEVYSELSPLLCGRCAAANDLAAGSSSGRCFRTFREPPMAIDNILYDVTLLTLTGCGMRSGAESDHNLLWATFEMADM